MPSTRTILNPPFAREYVRDALANGPSLAQLVAPRHAMDRGDCVVLGSGERTLDSVFDYSQASDAALDGAIAQLASLARQHALMHENTIVVLYDLSIYSYEEPPDRLSQVRQLARGKELYYWFPPAELTSDSAIKAFHWTINSGCDFAGIVGIAPSTLQCKNRLTTVDNLWMAALAESCGVVFCGAFDGEGMVVWTPRSSVTQLENGTIQLGE